MANQKEHATQEWKLFFRRWEAGPAQRARERVVRVRYELDGEVRQTLAELSLCKERVRQLQVEALVWLRRRGGRHG